MFYKFLKIRNILILLQKDLAVKIKKTSFKKLYHLIRILQQIYHH